MVTFQHKEKLILGTRHTFTIDGQSQSSHPKPRPAALSSERAFGGGGPAKRGEIVREEILYFLNLNTIYFHMIYQKGLSKRPIVIYLDPNRRPFCFGRPVQCIMDICISKDMKLITYDCPLHFSDFLV